LVDDLASKLWISFTIGVRHGLFAITRLAHFRAVIESCRHILHKTLKMLDRRFSTLHVFDLKIPRQDLFLKDQKLGNVTYAGISSMLADERIMCQS